jgi:hypothetical protein
LRLARCVPLLIAACGGLFGQGCRERACSQLACEDGIVIDLQPPIRRDGSYEIEARTDGTSRRCAFSLPRPRLAPESTLCSEQSQLRVSGIHDGLSRIVVTAVPQTLEVSISLDGKRVTHATLEPEYSDHRPNGQGCDPVCRVAELTLSTTAAVAH